MKNKIQEIAARIGWKTRKWNFKFELITIHLGNQEEFGFRCFTIHRNFYRHSLLSIFISLPNRTTRQRIRIDEWDVLWMHRRMWKRYDRLTDSIMWGQRKPSRTESIELWILDRLFK